MQRLANDRGVLGQVAYKSTKSTQAGGKQGIFASCCESRIGVGVTFEVVVLVA